MALQTFTQAMKNDHQDFTVFIGNTAYQGYVATVRIDRKTLPDGWYVYDMRHDDCGGDACELKNGYIFVNHFASFYTQNKLPLEPEESLFRGRKNDEFDYSFE